MKKLVVDKSEGIADVIDRMINEAEDEVAIVVPKNSVLVQSLSNFRLLKREADAAGKTVTVESVDDTVLAFAKESDLAYNHPLWKKQGGASGVADIVASSKGEDVNDDGNDGDADVAARARRVKKGGQKSTKLEVREEVMDDGGAEEEKEMESEAEEEMEPKEESFFGARRFGLGGRGGNNSNDDDDEEGDGRPGASRKKWLWTAVVVVVLAAALGIVTTVFGHVTVGINFKQAPWQYQADFTADKSVSVINPTGNIIPAQIFTNQKNTTQLFPASGEANVSLKAQGTITIYNDYSAASQELVATTRFETPGGLIFRITSDVIVPGEQMVNGVLTPSSITAPIVADQAGPSYNMGPVPKLTIPGFANGAKFNGFYGAIASGTTGGFIGNRAVPTAADIAAAKSSTTAVLESSLSDGLAATYPNNFKILDGATDVQVTQLVVNTTTDDNGDFSVVGVASLQAIGFDESALQAYLLSLAQAEEASSTFSTSTLDYSNVQADFTNGTVSFSLSATGSLEPAFSVADFKNEIAGQSTTFARNEIANLPELAQGSLSAWPFWLWDVPSNTNRIQVNVQ